VGDAGRLLALQLELERSFADEQARGSRVPIGWSPALIFFHVARWRGRLRSGLEALRDGRPYAQPGSIDDLNDGELPEGRDLPLSETSALARAELAELIRLYASMGDREFDWTITHTAGDAVVRNSYFHPRVHLGAFWQDNGDERRAHQLLENTVGELRELWPAPVILGAGLYNLATARVAQGRGDEALGLLEEAAPMRPDIVVRAHDDPDLSALRGNARFERLSADLSGMEGA
jgi:hypothetical protein